MNQWLQQLCHSATPSIDECVQQLGSVIPQGEIVNVL